MQMENEVKKDKKKINGKKKKVVIAIIVAVILLIGCVSIALFVNSLRLDFDTNIKKANNDIRYIATVYGENDIERYFFISEKDMIENFLKDMPKIDYAPSVKYAIADLTGSYSKEELKASLLVVCNVRDKGILTENSIGMKYDFLSFGDEIICSFNCNHDGYGSILLNKFKVDSLDVAEYIKEFTYLNTEKLTMDILFDEVNESIENEESLGVEDFGKYEYKSIVSDSGHKFGLTGIVAGSKEKMTIEIDDVYDLYVYFSSEAYTDAEEGVYYWETKTKGIILYNKNTEEYINLLTDLEKAKEFINSQGEL